MTINKIEEYIKKSEPSELVEFLKENPNLVYKMSNILFSKFSTLELVHDGCNGFTVQNLIELLECFFKNRPDVGVTEFNLLEELVRPIPSNTEKHVILNPDVFNKNPILSLVLLLIDMNDIVNDKIIHCNGLENTAACQLYQYIVDVYIPTLNPDLLIATFWRNYKFTDVIKNASNTNWFMKIYQENDLSKEVDMKDLLLLFKYISDIYSNREMKLEFFKELHFKFKKSYNPSEIMYTIANRFRFYFKEDTEYMIIDLLRIGLIEDMNELQDELEGFLGRFFRYNSRANTKVIECFVRDSLAFCITKYGKAKFANHILNFITENWNNPKYDVEMIECDDEILFADDKPITYLEGLTSYIATEAVHKDSSIINKGERKIYKAYKTYKDAEEKVDSQISKALNGMKNVITGDTTSEIIEGKKFSAIGLLKKLLTTVAIFSYSKIAGVIALVVRYALKKKTKDAERSKILMELETEIEMITEKIEDAKGDDNREAKYSMMRTKKELETAYKRISLGLDADKKSKDKALATINASRKGKL